MIYLSTGGFSDLKGSESARLLSNAGIHEIEMSGGAHEPDAIKVLNQLKECGINLALHNYFPPPKDPFVLNLASLDDEVESRSIRHVQSVLEYCSELGLSHYSIHGGFLVDPNPEELGKPINRRRINDRNVSVSKFIENVNAVAKKAKEYGVVLLLENNVLGQKNLNNFPNNPFLMTCKEECLKIMRESDDNVRLLVDVGHLKVSAESLKFDKDLFLQDLDSHIGGYHLSENDGKEDQNLCFDKGSWFWPLLRKDVEYVSIEVYDKCVDVLKQQKEMAESFFAMPNG